MTNADRDDSDQQDGVNHYPVDYDRLKKGDRFDEADLELILHMQKTHPRFPLKVLGFRGSIERELRNRGLVVTTRGDKGALVICDDPDAATTNRKEGRRALRKFARCHYRNLAVDAGKLTAAERDEHERTLTIQGAILVAIRKVKRKLLVGPTTRNTPAIANHQAAASEGNAEV